MKSRVFISCGQHSPTEVQIAGRIARTLEDRGFETYVAKEVQNVFEITSGIIDQLKGSDCYLFINFRREEIGSQQCRGSLFSNQEFAIAFALGFDRIIVVNQRGVVPDGMLRYIGCNTEAFETEDECIGIVEQAITRSGWQPGFSRRLMAENLRFEKTTYRHFTGELMDGRFLSLDIANRRPEVAALETSGRFVGFRRRGEQVWTPRSEMHRSLLKASGRAAFSHTIFPGSSDTFTLLYMGAVNRRPGVYLVSAIDLVPNQPLPLESGEWELFYEFCAIGFPLLSVQVGLTYREYADAVSVLIR